MPITELRIEGLRTIENIRLKLDGLTVLIGENGSGKSSIIEACELLRRASSESFLDEFYSIHGGLAALLRQGAERLRLGVTISPRKGEYSPHENKSGVGFEAVEYDLSLIPVGSFAMIEEEVRVKGAGKAPRTQRRSKQAKPRGTRGRRRTSTVAFRHGEFVEVSESEASSFTGTIDEQRTFVAQFSPLPSLGRDAMQIVAASLRNLRVHLPFEVIPAWAARAFDRKSALRTSSPFAPADHLEKLGVNLANAFHALKNSYGKDEWQQTLSYVRLGLGEHIEDVTTWPDPGGGNIGLSLKLRNLDRQIPSSQLSDGMLSYLAFVALFRLHGSQPSLMALDEPDLHLHPRLLMRVLDMFEAMARTSPVLLATHSDRLLDGLSDPAQSVVLCELDESQTTRLFRPDPGALARWLERYRGLGDIRSAGHEASVLTRREPV
jgi:predicted ATPase